MISLDSNRVSATLLVWMSAKAKAKKEPKGPKASRSVVAASRSRGHHGRSKVPRMVVWTCE